MYAAAFRYEFLPAVDAPLRDEFLKRGGQDCGVPYFDQEKHFFSGVNNTCAALRSKRFPSRVSPRLDTCKILC